MYKASSAFCSDLCFFVSRSQKTRSAPPACFLVRSVFLLLPGPKKRARPLNESVAPFGPFLVCFAAPTNKLRPLGLVHQA